MSFIHSEDTLQFKIGMLVDNELNHEEKTNLEKNIACDPRCQHMLTEEKEFRAFIKNHVQRPSTDPTTIDFIKSIFD